MPISRSDELAILDPQGYQANGYPWDAFEKLRREDPVHFVEREAEGSFWAVVNHADIIAIEGRPDIFENGPKLAFGDNPGDNVRMIINMDPPDHKAYRSLVASRFMPQSIRWVRGFAEATVHAMLDRAMERNGEELDLLRDIIEPVPTATIAHYIGVEEDLIPQMIDWTNRVIGSGDPAISGGRDPVEFAMEAVNEMSMAFAELFEQRRANPRDDLLTDLVNARLGGEPLPFKELLSFCYILTTAGHETTQSTATSGIHALLQHPDQLALLQSDPALMGKTVDEIIRWVTPVVHFCRTPNQDVEVAGKLIRKGETMAMLYPAANRDPTVFSDPYRFDIQRAPNRHLGFGTGPHICLGMHLGRMQIAIIIEQILRRAERIEIVGPPQYFRNPIIGGVKHLPVRMNIRPRSD